MYFSGFPKSMDVGKQFDKRAGAEREVIGRKGGRYASPKQDFRGGKLHSGADTTKTAMFDAITAPATPLARKWDGWGTALKPAHEPIILARKPLDGTVCDNVERWGTGAINIDGCRIPLNGEKQPTGSGKREGNGNTYHLKDWVAPNGGNGGNITPEKGRFPANCITLEPDAFYSKYFNVTPPELSKKASKKDRLSTWDGGQVEANRHPTVKPTDLMAW